MAQLVPAILAKSQTEFERKINQVEGLVESVQIDVMDGDFVPNTTFNDVAAIKAVKTDLAYKIHLMVNDVATATKNWLKIQPARITVHAKAVNENQIKKIAEQLRRSDCQLGLAIDLDVELSAIEPLINYIDYILIMGVKPGFSGQEFQPDTLARVQEIKNIYPQMRIGVDGGVNIDNADKIVAAGADEIITGSAIFASPDVPEAVEKLQAICQ